MGVGEIITNPRHYVDQITGELRTKHFLILANSRAGDLIIRLLTSRQHGRQKAPACSHIDPYPSFYMGHIGGALTSQSWLDLRFHPDLDGAYVAAQLARGQMRAVATIAGSQLIEAMECAAGAPDTTRAQEQAIRDSLSLLR